MKKSYMTRHNWTPDEDEWLNVHFDPKDRERIELLTNFNKTFNCNVTMNGLRLRCHSLKLLLPNSDYTPEMEEWIRKNYTLDGATAQETTDEFNRVFGTKKTKSSIWHKAFRLTRIRVSDEPRSRLEYTPEMIERIKEIVPKWSYAKCAQMMSEEFNYKFTPGMLEHKAQRLGIKKPRNGFDNLDPRIPSINWFQKGRPSLNKLPVGTETVMNYKNGKSYIHVKVGEPSEWEYKHRLIWKQHYGEIPEDHMIIFLDGNTLNCDIENLACINKVEHNVLNRTGLRFDNTELTKTGINIAKLMIAKNKRRNKNEKHTSRLK